MKRLALLFVLIASAAGAQTTTRTTATILATFDSPAQFGQRMDYNAATDMFAIDRRGIDGYFDVRTMEFDGSDETCLTCAHATLTSLGYTGHIGNPTFNHAGTHILFLAQFVADTNCTDDEAQPGIGGCNDLIVMDADGSDVVVLHEVARSGVGGILHIAMSPVDTHVMFAERTDLTPTTWGLTKCAIEFVGAPSVSSCGTEFPGSDLFSEAHQCLENDCDLVLFSCICGESQTSLADMDLATYRFSTDTMVNLTNTPGIWDEHGHKGEDGRIVWISSRGYLVASELQTEFWIMDGDGLNQRRLSFFNDSNSSQYLGIPITAADSAWISRTMFIGTNRSAALAQGPFNIYQIIDTPRTARPVFHSGVRVNGTGR